MVQELASIIGGIVKPKISPFPREIAQLISGAKDLPGEINLTWDIGLPESEMGEDHSIDMEVNGMSKFHVPFQIKDETFHLVVLIKVLMLLVSKYKARVASASFAHPCSHLKIRCDRHAEQVIKQNLLYQCIM